MVYTCPFCLYTTVWSTNFKNHVYTHLDNKPYECATCSHKFTTKQNCQVHEAKCGRQRVKVNEERVLSFLESTGLEFRREVVVWFDRSQRRYARVDFVVPFEDRLVYIEVDEHQHVDYDQRKDLERTWHLFETCPKPLHLVRLNPDAFTVNGRRHEIFWSQRMELLLEAINAEVWGITYMCYDGALKLTVPLAIIFALGLRSSVGPSHWSPDRQTVQETLGNGASARSLPA